MLIISTVSVLSDVETHVDTIKPSSVHCLKEKKFLHQLSDVRSELVIILSILREQKGVLYDLLNCRRKAELAEDEPKISLDLREHYS